MRLIEKEIPVSGKTRLLFATNKKELELLLGVVNKAIRLFPKTGETQSAHSRLSNIRNSPKGVRSIGQQ